MVLVNAGADIGHRAILVRNVGHGLEDTAVRARRLDVAHEGVAVWVKLDAGGDAWLGVRGLHISADVSRRCHPLKGQTYIRGGKRERTPHENLAGGLLVNLRRQAILEDSKGLGRSRAADEAKELSLFYFSHAVSD